MRRSFVRCGVLAACLWPLSGCIWKTVDPNARPATSIDPKLAQSEYWFNQPSVEKIISPDYDLVWNACESAAVDVGFTIDRTDYRIGLLTTKPLVSKQLFEVWRGDVVDSQSQADSDTTTHRRTVRFQITRLKDGTYLCEPRAVVEHYAMTERRITAVYQYRDAFSTHRQFEEQAADDGTPLRVDYWYAERRDEKLEHALAVRIRGYVNGNATRFRIIAEAPAPPS